MYSYHRSYETTIRKFKEKVEDLVAGNEGVIRADECIADGRRFLEDGNDENQMHLNWLFPGFRSRCHRSKDPEEKAEDEKRPLVA